MPARTNDLLAASFRGVSFFVRSEAQTDGGRKVVLHEYPNSSERFVEDLGKIPPRFSVTAFVSGSDYLNRAKALEGVLEEGGSGRLVMPTLGAFDVYPLQYRKNATQTSVGEISYTLEFAAGNVNNAPILNLFSEESVFSIGDDVRITAEAIFKDAWQEVSDRYGSLVAEYDLTAISDAVDFAFEAATEVEEAIAFAKSVKQIADNVAEVVRNADQIAKNLISTGTDYAIGLFQQSSIGVISGKGYDAAVSLFNFGSDLGLQLSSVNRSSTDFYQTVDPDDTRDIPLWPDTTAQRIERNENRLLLVDTTRLNALIIAYEQAASASYDTAEQIDEVVETIENQYELLFNVDGTDSSRILGNNDIARAVENMRIATLQVLTQKQQNTYRTVEVENIGMPSVPVLSSLYYYENIKNTDDLDLAVQTLRTLNSNQSSVSLNNQAVVVQGAK